MGLRNGYLAHHPFGDWADTNRGALSRTRPRFVDKLGINEVEGSQPRP
jgi:adenylate cyclase